MGMVNVVQHEFSKGGHIENMNTNVAELLVYRVTLYKNKITRMKPAFLLFFLNLDSNIAISWLAIHAPGAISVIRRTSQGQVFFTDEAEDILPINLDLIYVCCE